VVLRYDANGVLTQAARQTFCGCARDAQMRPALYTTRATRSGALAGRYSDQAQNPSHWLPQSWVADDKTTASKGERQRREASAV